MKLDKIHELIDNSSLLTVQKNIIKGFIRRAKEDSDKRIEDRQLIEKVTNENKLSEVIFSNDEVKIYTVFGVNEWNIKYPFRGIFMGNSGRWERIGKISPTFEIAFLNYLEYKHLGHNSQFADFAIKMLEITLEQ